MTEADELHLRRAIELAAAARAAGDMPYGSLLVGPAGDVLAEDRNTVVTERDITAHPELKLARWAARQLDADVGAADHDVHELPAVPHVRGCDRALRARARRRLRALRRPVAEAQASRSRYPRRGAGGVRRPSVVRSGSRSDRRLLRLSGVRVPPPALGAEPNLGSALGRACTERRYPALAVSGGGVVASRSEPAQHPIHAQRTRRRRAPDAGPGLSGRIEAAGDARPPAPSAPGGR